jgi:hypothetical protein
LFTGSDKRAERLAIGYTLFGSCQMHGIDPLAWATYMIGKLQAGWRWRAAASFGGPWRPITPRGAVLLAGQNDVSLLAVIVELSYVKGERPNSDDGSTSFEERAFGVDGGAPRSLSLAEDTCG